jgi:hypothetical protein
MPPPPPPMPLKILPTEPISDENSDATLLIDDSAR